MVEPTDGRGLRFVAWACSKACAVELCAVARKHGRYNKKPLYAE